MRPAAKRYVEQVQNELEFYKQERKELEARIKAELERQLREHQTPEVTDNDRKALEKSIRKRLEAGEKTEFALSDGSTLLHSLNYYNAQSRTEWFFADIYVKEDFPCSGVVVWKFDETGRMLSRDTAYKAEYDYDARNWRLFGGETVHFEYSEGNALPQPSTSTRLGDAEVRVLPYPDTPQEIELLHHQPDELNLVGLLAMLRFAERLPQARQHFVRTMVAYRFFYPLSTLIAGLLGFALTLTQGRKSAITGFVVAAVLLMVYYSVAQQSVVLGRSGTLPAFIAGALPTILALAGTLFLAWKRQ